MPITSLPTQVTESESTWVESESIRQLGLRVVGTQRQAFVATFLLFALLYTHTPMTQWLIWVALHGLVFIVRLWFMGNSQVNGEHGNADAQAAFYLRHISIVALIGFAWGSTVYLINGKEPSIIEAICFNMVLIYGVASAIYLSRHLQSLNLFVRGYGIGLLGAFAARMAFDNRIDVAIANSLLILVMVLLTVILGKFGKQLNLAHINSLRLQFHNKQLIDSLTSQTKTSMAAVATKNRFLASAAHDMRQPVLALDLYADWLLKEPELSPQLSPKIAVATKAVITLFDSMFDMARLAVGQLSAQETRVNIQTLMEELTVQYLPIAHAKKLTLRTRMLDGELWTDPILLKRVLSNLMSNAIKYTQTGGVLLACRKTQRGVRFEVWDTGVGIAANQQDLVFREFYKSSDNVGTSDGFGLGLAIVTQLSELLGYELTMKSRLGRGTVVSVQLSAAAMDWPAP